MQKKELEIVFSQDMELCYDGVNPRQYKKGKSYSPTHAHEKRMFEAFLADGRASLAGKAQSKADQPEPEKEKVVTPKQTKKKSKSKSK